MNKAAYDRLGAPEAFQLLYDGPNNAIGLRPTIKQKRNAYPAFKPGRHGGRRVNAYRLLMEFGIHVKETLFFPDAEIDPDGILVLNLRSAEVPNRVLKHPTRNREFSVSWLRGDPAFDALRDDRRFQDWRKELVFLRIRSCYETLPGMQTRLLRRQPALLSRRRSSPAGRPRLT